MNRLTMPFSTADDSQKVAAFIFKLNAEGVRFNAEQDFDMIVFTFPK